MSNYLYKGDNLIYSAEQLTESSNYPKIDVQVLENNVERIDTVFDIETFILDKNGNKIHAFCKIGDYVMTNIVDNTKKIGCKKENFNILFGETE